jgi:ADP-heptose:LPS heptosyltransferase
MPDAIVIQWARLGDLLQTRVLLRRLQQEGRHRVILCADARYAAVAECLREVDDYWPIDLAQWSAQARHESAQPILLDMLATCLSKYRVTDVDEVYVLNYSAAAVAFAELLRPRRMCGFTRQGDVLHVPRTFEWIEHARRNHHVLPVHIADIWAEFTPTGYPVEWLQSLGGALYKIASPAANRIGFICDAGAADREIPEVWLAELVFACAERGRQCVLLGRNKRSGALMQAQSALPDSVTDYRGKTDLTSLMKEISVLDVVMGPDTGGLHLAAALDVPVIGLYFGGAAAANTGPYSDKAVVLQEPAWTHETAVAVLHLIDEMTCGTVTISTTFKNAFMPQMDKFGLCFLPPHDQAARSRIMNERQQLFNTIRQKSVAETTVVPI